VPRIEATLDFLEFHLQKLMVLEELLHLELAQEEPLAQPPDPFLP